MKGFNLFLLAGAFVVLPAGAQSSASSQTTATSSTVVKAGAGQTGAQVQTSTQGSQQTQTSKQSDKNNKQTQRGGSGSAANQTGGSATAGPASVNLASGTAVNATLLTTLDAKRSKPGDQVIAKTTQDVKQNGQVVLKKGSKLLGHVTQAQARGNGNSNSAIGIVFDQAQTKGGQTVPLNLAIQALAASQNALAADLGDTGGSGSLMTTSGGGGTGRTSGGGLLGGIGSTVGGATQTTGNVVGGVDRTAGGAVGASTGTVAGVSGSAGRNSGALNAAGQLTSSASGVFGLQGLNLNSGLTGSAQGQGSLVTSSSRNVHLASGTQLLLTATGQAGKS